MKKYALGTDIGGSHITCAVIDLEKKSILKETISTQKVNNKESADAILGNWLLAINKTIKCIDEKELAGIGFAMPGPFEYTKGIAGFTSEVDKYENLYGVNIAEFFTDMLSLESTSNVRFMNDASAFAVGEAWLGKAAGVRKSVSITLGTGFGSAFIDSGLPVVDRDDVPKMGCVWHLPFSEGIGDDYFSTRWFIKRYEKGTGRQMVGVKEIAEIASHDSYAREVFIEYGQNLGFFLGPWLEKFNADALVIGGNVSAAYPLFGGYFEEILYGLGVKTSVYISGLMEDAALIGSARMFEDEFWVKVKPLLAKM